MDVSEIEQRLRGFFAARRDGIAAAYLFGSLGRGTPGPESDVDVAVLFTRRPPAALNAPPLALEGDLERLLGRCVDLVVLNSAPPDLVHRILRDGRILFEGDRSARIAFEVRTRNEYFDLLPFLRRYRKRERAAS